MKNFLVKHKVMSVHPFVRAWYKNVKSWVRLLRLEMSDNLHSLLYLCVLKSTLWGYTVVQLFMGTEVHFMGVNGGAAIYAY